MSKNTWQDQLTVPVRVMQIIVLALASGCATFAVIVIVLNLGGQEGPEAAQPDLLVITYAALAAIVPMLIAFFVLRSIWNSQARRLVIKAVDEASGESSDLRPTQWLESTKIVSMLVPVFQTRLIIGAALFEGTAFFLLIAYMVEGSIIALVAALAVAVGILLQFPTRSGVAGWIEQQTEAVRNQRQFSR
ncbi:MAG: hypothetical protein JW888_10040 [Pirellulales bacterium]|nr:hypothetical protein [Pirellulales bacterium]